MGLNFSFLCMNQNLKCPHVHVKYQSGEAVFWLKPVNLFKNSGLNRKELANAKKIVVDNEQFGKKN